MILYHRYLFLYRFHYFTISLHTTIVITFAFIILVITIGFAKVIMLYTAIATISHSDLNRLLQ